MELGVAGNADYWIGSCRFTNLKYIKAGVPQQRLFLSYYGTDLTSFSDRPPGKLRRELNIDKNTQLVGMVAFMYAPKRYLGQIRGLKGHEDLVDAIALLAKNNPHIIGVFVGGAWNNATTYEKRVRDYAKKRCGERAIFLGTRKDVPEIYPDFDVAVHPSHSENVGGAVESFLLKIPTIASDVGGFPDLVIPGETGWLVPPRAPHKLAEAILEALRDPDRSREMADNGKQLTRHLFDVRRTAAEVFEIYAAVLNK
jgi:glycosyltransferase involved in cell wall biosynthesis